jgi:hypothetical protein
MTRALVVVLLIASAAPRALAREDRAHTPSTNSARGQSTNVARGRSTNSADSARTQSNASALARADKLLAQLARLDAAARAIVTRGDAHQAEQVASRAFQSAQGLPEGDLKVDLSTSARLYERAFARQLAPRASDADSHASCADERPGAYRVLCAATSGRDMITLLLAKARRHAEWARAFVADGRGVGGARIASALAEMRAERVLDLVVARQALVALGELEAATNAPATLADYEEEKQIGKVSPAEFGGKLDAAAQTIKQSLAWLPESSLKNDIDNAWQSYRDAFWWWQRSDRPLVVHVAGNKFAEQNFAAMSHLPDTQLGYNAVANLRHAREYTRRAASLLDAELSRAGVATMNH